MTTIMLRFFCEHSSKEYQTSAKINVNKINYFVCVIICIEQNKMALDKIITSLHNIFITDFSVF